MARSTNLTSGRPDGKQENIISLKGYNGLAPHSLMYSKDDYVLPRDTFGLMSGSAFFRYGEVTITGNPNNISISNGSMYIILASYPFGTEEYGTALYDGLEENMYIESDSRYYKIHHIKSDVVRFLPEYGDVESDFTLGGTYNVILTKQHPQLLTYGESLKSEGLQNPDNLPAEWKSHLAGGNVTALIPNLVDDQGNSNLPDGSKTTFKMTSKMKERYGVLASQDNGATWLKSGTTAFNDEYISLTYDYVANTITFGTAPAVGDIIVADQSSWATPYTQLDPQKITKVTPKSIATNSHSVYKDALITWLATDKIAVGNGSNGYESKVLENVTETFYEEIKVGSTIDIVQGKVYYVSKESAEVGSIVTGDNKYGYFYRVGVTVSGYTVPNGYNISSESAYVYLGENTIIGSTPQHSTHTLDSSPSSACKYFEVEFEFADGSKGEGVITQELIYNETDTDYGDDTGDFGNLTNGTDTDLLAQTIKTGFFGRRK